MPIRGRTPSFSAYSRTRCSSENRSTTADLLREHRRLDELGVLEAVADDRRVVVGQRDHGQQFRLAAGFQPEAEGLAELQHLLHHLALLVDLHRIHAAVIAAVSTLLHGVGEDAVNLSEPVLQDFGEPQQDRQVDAADLQPVDELFEVDALGRILVGMHQQVAGRTDGEVTIAPAGDLVQVGGVRAAPVFEVEVDCHQGGLTGGGGLKRGRPPFPQSVASAASKAMPFDHHPPVLRDRRPVAAPSATVRSARATSASV
jgi:hypothetical protein